jgi:hypothetical protein
MGDRHSIFLIHQEMEEVSDGPFLFQCHPIAAWSELLGLWMVAPFNEFKPRCDDIDSRYSGWGTPVSNKVYSQTTNAAL